MCLPLDQYSHCQDLDREEPLGYPGLIRVFDENLMRTG